MVQEKKEGWSAPQASQESDRRTLTTARRIDQSITYTKCKGVCRGVSPGAGWKHPSHAILLGPPCPSLLFFHLVPILAILYPGFEMFLIKFTVLVNLCRSNCVYGLYDGI